MIKNFLCYLVICLLVFNSCKTSNANNVPEIVIVNFNKKYPNQDNSAWELDSNGNFETHFKKDGVTYRADFSPEGLWIETETNIKKDALPEAIIKAINTNYAEEEISEIEKVDSAKKGIFYDVEFKNKGKNKDVEFLANGKEL